MESILQGVRDSNKYSPLTLTNHSQPPTSSNIADFIILQEMFAAFKAAAKSLKREVLALFYAVHDPRTPFFAKLIPWLVLAYALSPIDLIPDFIPILGLVDDLLLLPGLIWLALHLIPPEVKRPMRSYSGCHAITPDKWCMGGLWTQRAACMLCSTRLISNDVHRPPLIDLGCWSNQILIW